MAKSGPIILIDDDRDDQELLEEVIREMKIPNQLNIFKSGNEAYKYLKETTEQPFLIFCDVNLPGISGLEFKKQIDEDPQLRNKSIPFIFYSTSVGQSAVNEAYTSLSVQGFFQKSNNYDDIKKIIRLIIEYWKYCKHPNTF